MPRIFENISTGHLCSKLIFHSEREGTVFKNKNRVVQRLRLRAPNSGALGSIPGPGTRSCMLQQRARSLNECSARTHGLIGLAFHNVGGPHLISWRLSEQKTEVSWWVLAEGPGKGVGSCARRPPGRPPRPPPSRVRSRSLSLSPPAWAKTDHLNPVSG